MDKEKNHTRKCLQHFLSEKNHRQICQSMVIRFFANTIFLIGIMFDVFSTIFLCLECVATTLLLPLKSFGANTGSQLNLFSTEKLKLLQPLYLYAVIVYEDIKHSVKHFSNGYGSHRLCKQIESHKWTECENVQCKHTDSVTHTYRNVHEKCHHFLCHAFNRENSKKPKELSRAATWNVAC